MYMKNGSEFPNNFLDKIIKILNINGPKAAIAEVHPITPAALLGDL